MQSGQPTAAWLVACCSNPTRLAISQRFCRGGEQEEIMYEWFEPYFEPWTHYVPMRFDLSDLWEKVEWSAPPCSRHNPVPLLRPPPPGLHLSQSHCAYRLSAYGVPFR